MRLFLNKEEVNHIYSHINFNERAKSRVYSKIRHIFCFAHGFTKEFRGKISPAYKNRLLLPNKVKNEPHFVLFSHGYLSSAYKWSSYKECCEALNVQFAFLDFNRGHRGPIDDSVNLVKRKIKKFLHDHPKGKISLVGHSYGAINVRALVDSIEEGHKFNRKNVQLISIAGALNGSKLFPQFILNRYERSGFWKKTLDLFLGKEVVKELRYNNFQRRKYLNKIKRLNIKDFYYLALNDEVLGDTFATSLPFFQGKDLSVEKKPDHLVCKNKGREMAKIYPSLGHSSLPSAKRVRNDVIQKVASFHFREKT